MRIIHPHQYSFHSSFIYSDVRIALTNWNRYHDQREIITLLWKVACGDGMLCLEMGAGCWDLMSGKVKYPISLIKYHGCWWPGGAKIQDISSHVIDSSLPGIIWVSYGKIQVKSITIRSITYVLHNTFSYRPIAVVDLSSTWSTRRFLYCTHLQMCRGIRSHLVTRRCMRMVCPH